jgi:hypothetical protein
MDFSRRQILWIVCIASTSLAVALCVRYLVVENPKISEMCEGWAPGWDCASRRAFISAFQYLLFGWIALFVAALNLFRPSMPMLSIAVAATSWALVLYNAGLAALATALLLLSLARLPQGTASMPGQ